MTITRYLEIPQTSLAISIAFIYVMFYVMRKLYARVSWRIGPKYVGPSGILQVLADILKFMVKEDVVPDIEPRYMRIIYGATPFALLGLSLATVAATPLPYSITHLSPLPGSLIWVLFLVSLDIVVMIVATWYLNSKYAFLGSYRTLAQSLSYDAVLALSLLAPAVAARTASLDKISSGIHGIWFIILLPIGFVAALIGVLAEVEATPFDVPEAPTEVVGGWEVEYTGPRFLSLFLAKRMESFALMLVISYEYLGGDSCYLFTSWLCVLLKTFLLALLVIYITASYPRYSLRGVIEKGWRLWVPLAYASFILSIIYAYVL